MDKFFSQLNCDRCGDALISSRKMSWFKDECLCMDCIEIEGKLREELEQSGVDVSELEGCGYIPEVKNTK